MRVRYGRVVMTFGIAVAFAGPAYAQAFAELKNSAVNYAVTSAEPRLSCEALATAFTDKELVQILREDYGIELSRRSITYHRNRCFKESNFYSRVRNMKGPGSGSEPDEAHH